MSVTKRPTARGSLSGLSDIPATGFNWTKVADAVADDATYVYKTGNASFPISAADLYATDTIANFGHLTSITIHCRAKSQVGSNNTISPCFKIDGSTYTAPADTLLGVWGDYNWTYTASG